MGWTVPEPVELHNVPDIIVSDIPTVKGYIYFVSNDDVVLVDPKTRKVVTIVEQVGAVGGMAFSPAFYEKRPGFPRAFSVADATDLSSC